MSIPVLTKLQSNLSDFKEQMKQIDTSTKPLRKTREPHWLRWCGDDAAFKKLYKTGSTSSEVIEYIERWINSTKLKCVPEPTWRNFFKILKDASSELGQLAYQIKELFHGMYSLKSSCITMLTYMLPYYT